MSSQKSKAFSFGSKRSQSISTSKPASPSPGDTLKTKRSQFAMLASLPFRYAFTNSSNMLIKQSSMINSTDVKSIQQHTYQSSNLIKNSIDESASEVGVSEENLVKQPSFSSCDIDDYKPVTLIFNREDLERTVAESHPAFGDMALNMASVLNEEDDNLVGDSTDIILEGDVEYKVNDTRIMNNFTLPNNLPEDLASALRKTAIRRHHSAPQSEAKWLQVVEYLI
jgi:hypothetical protein